MLKHRMPEHREPRREPLHPSRREFLRQVAAAAVAGGLAPSWAAACAGPRAAAALGARPLPDGAELLREPLVLGDGASLVDRVLVLAEDFRVTRADAAIRVEGSKVRIRNVRLLGSEQWDPRWNTRPRRSREVPSSLSRTAGIRIEKVRDVELSQVDVEGFPRSGILGSRIDGGVFRDLRVHHCWAGLRLEPPGPNRHILVERVEAWDMWAPADGTWNGWPKRPLPSRQRPGGFIGGDGVVLNSLRDSVVADCSATGELYGAFKLTNPQRVEARGLRGTNLMVQGTAGNLKHQWDTHKTPSRDTRIHDCVFDKGLGWGACALGGNCLQISQNVESLLIEACTLKASGHDGHAIQLAHNAHARVVGCTIEGFNGVRGANPAHAVDLAHGSTINADFAQVNRFIDQKRILLDRNRRTPAPAGRAG